MTTLQQMTEGQNNAHVVCNENIDTLSASGIYGKKQTTTSGLVWGFYGGLYNGATIADGTVTLTNAADNYVVVLRSTGVVSTSTSSANSLNALYTKLYKLTTAGSVVTVELDQRMDTNGLLFDTAGGGGGSVTSVSVTTANGVSGTVATATTTPAITLTLGAITPSSVAASGSVTGSNLSGTNTGDQSLAAYAPLASPTFTGTPAVPTAAPGTNTTQAASTAFVDAAVGDVATDVIWDAAGDLAQGTGANTAARLALGTALQVLRVNSGATAAEWAAATRVGLAFEQVLALSDLTTAITTGTTKAYWRPSFAATGVSARSSLRVTSSSGIPTVDMNKAGSTMMSTKLTIDASELTSVTAAVPVVMSTTTWAIDDLIEFDIDVAGTGAMGLIVTVTGMYA